MDVKEIIKTIKNLKVLYVEDNKDALEELSKILKKIFISVDLAQNGEEGLKLFNQNDYDLIITDISMPKMNGIDMLKKIKKQKPEIYSVFITAFNETDYYLEAIKIGVDGFILKPVDLEQILSVFAKIGKSYYHKKQAEKYFSLLTQYQEVVDNNAVVCKVDLEGHIVYINDVFERLLKYDKKEILGKHYKVLLKEFSENHREKVLKIVRDEKKIWNGVVKFVNKDHKTIFLQASLKAIFEGDEVIEYIFIGYDITEIMKPRKFLIDYIKTHDNPVLALVEIDNFENIRRLFDESFTEELENKFQKLLEKVLPDTVEEIYTLENGIFGAVFDDKNNEYADFIEKMKKALSELNNSMLELKGLKYDVYSLISIAKGKDAFENARFGLEKLHKEKQNFIISNGLIEKEKEKAKNNLKVLHILKEAINNNNIVCAFQPIIDNKTLKPVKYEALMRIKRGSTLIPPGEFLNIAKEGSFYTQLTEIVLTHSIEKIKQCNKISINLSEIDIEKDNIRRFIINLLQENIDVAEHITFELLEDENVEKITNIDEFIEKIKSYGVSIAIDDFGSGYSNFYRLKKYRPDYLKIDGSLIRDIVNDKFSESIVRTIVDFAKENNIKTVAEYVENRKIFEKIKELGVDYSQGYYFGKPVLLNNL